MKTWLLSRWDNLRGSFWFIPLLMVASAFVLSIITLLIDEVAVKRDIDLTFWWTFSRGPEGSRALLATVAGSLITIASMSFSITVVALQQASSQFGPRVLHNFMRDRGNQVVLGTFISGFTYCLLVLRSVNGTEEHRFVPHLSVTVGLGLALAGVAVLIYFIHHAAASIQAEYVISAVSRDLHDALERLFPRRLGEGAEQPAQADLPDGFPAASVPIAATASDYLQAVNTDRLLELAVKHDLVVQLDRRPGQFITLGQPIARGWPVERVTPEVADALRHTFYLGSRRTLFQDVEFAIDQLVEIAVRALSPGINDPFTALACVDRLGAALCELADREMPSAYRHDDSGRLRVVANVLTAGGIVDAAFHQIRQAARGNAAVTLRQLEMIATVLRVTRPGELRDALLFQADVIHKGSQEGLAAEVERAAASERYQAVQVVAAAVPSRIL